LSNEKVSNQGIWKCIWIVVEVKLGTEYGGMVKIDGK
jgi:hypothetical protein